MTSWHSYPKVYNLGHKYLEHLFNGPVVIQEKVDGSQFSFGMFDGELRVRSKGVEMNPHAPEKMFNAAVQSVMKRASLLHPGVTYRAEYLAKPKHNTLAYDRIPRDHLILFDANTAEETYVGPEGLSELALELGLETVPVLAMGVFNDPAQIHSLLNTTSQLGGQKIEGVVIKNYARFGLDGKALMGKHVSEAFKEVHAGEWKAANPSRSDVVQGLIDALRTPARWEKAIQHLRERGELLGEPKDIGALIKEVQQDIREECGPQIADALVKWALPQILRGTIAGLPEWYKEKLLKQQFGGV